jgi:hypothetical protein
MIDHPKQMLVLGNSPIIGKMAAGKKEKIESSRSDLDGGAVRW